MFNQEDIYESEYDCDGCIDFRKNLRCCREIFDLMENVEANEKRISTIEERLFNMETRLQNIERTH